MGITEFKAEYCDIARRLYRLRQDDQLIADYFGVDLLCIALWAWENEEFFNAITPGREAVEQWRKADAEAKALAAARRKKNRNRSPSARINNSMRSRMWHAVKGKKVHSLPYSTEDLMQHLESRMLPGMTWENYGSWHIDHIKPYSLSDLTIKEQFDACWGLLNLQPLWAHDNVKKGAKYAGA